MAETRTEFGVRFEDGLVWPRDDREQAKAGIQSIQGRHGTGRLVWRTASFTDWTDAEEHL